MLPQSPIGGEPGVTINARGPARPGPMTVQAALAGGPRTREVTALDGLHRALPAPLRIVPMPALLAWSGVGAIAAAVLCSIALRSPRAIEALEEASAVEPSASASASAPPTTVATSKPPAQRATGAEIDEARLAGTEALSALAQRFPDDPAVAQVLFVAQAGDRKSHGAALRSARHLLELVPAAAANDEVRRALVTIANGPTETAVPALDLMAKELGERGAEMLFEVASGNVLLSKTKAAALLADSEVRRHATPALLIANDLRAALPCARKLLIGRARADADARSLPFLKPLASTTCGGGGGNGGLRGFIGRATGNNGGGGGECYRCFSAAEKADIQGIVASIEARAANPAPTAAP